MNKEVRDCFVFAIKDEQKGKKHKGLLITKQDTKTAEVIAFVKAREILIP